MFKRKKEVQDAIDRVLVLLRRHKRGDTVGWPEVEHAAGFARYTTHWSAMMQRLRRTFLRVDRISLWAVTDVGLRLHTIEEQLYSRSIKRQRKALKQMTWERKELSALPDRLLTERQRQDKYRKLSQVRDSRNSVLRSVRLAHVLAKPTGGGVPHARPPS